MSPCWGNARGQLAGDAGAVLGKLLGEGRFAADATLREKRYRRRFGQVDLVVAVDRVQCVVHAMIPLWKPLNDLCDVATSARRAASCCFWV